MNSEQTEFRERGFVIIENVLSSDEISELRISLAEMKLAPGESDRPHGVRDLLNRSVKIREFAGSPAVLNIVHKFLTADARPVRSIYFDKNSRANWKVPWHQDLTIAVKDKIEIDGFYPWTRKADIWHVQPTMEVMKRILTLRFHLDETDETNGALKVLPGTHWMGRLPADKIAAIRAANESTICRVKEGDCLVMSPLLLHSSSAGTMPGRRRVVHLEYSDVELPGGLTWHGS